MPKEDTVKDNKKVDTKVDVKVEAPKTPEGEPKFFCSTCNQSFTTKKRQGVHNRSAAHKKRVKKAKDANVANEPPKPAEPKKPEEPKKPSEPQKPKEELKKSEPSKATIAKEKEKEEIREELDKKATDDKILGKEGDEPEEINPPQEPEKKFKFNKGILYYGGIAVATVAVIMIFFNKRTPVVQAPTVPIQPEKPKDEHEGYHPVSTGTGILWVKNV